MSEITSIRAEKENENTVILTVSSFRDDALPNATLSADDIAKTCFVLFVNSLSQENCLPELLREALQEKISFNFLDLYFSQASVDLFIKEAKIVHSKSSADFRISDLELNSNQISALFAYMGYKPEDGDYDLNDDFYVEIFKKGDRGRQVRTILGAEKYSIIEPKIIFEFQFNNPLHIESFDETETESALDTFISDWLKRE